MRQAGIKATAAALKSKRLIATFTSSGTFNASSYTDYAGNTLGIGSNVDLFIVSGGQGGSGYGSSGTLRTGNGGNGGEITLLSNYGLPATSIPVVIGAGGEGGATVTGSNYTGQLGKWGGISYFGDIPSGPTQVAYRTYWTIGDSGQYFEVIQGHTQNDRNTGAGTSAPYTNVKYAGSGGSGGQGSGYDPTPGFAGGGNGAPYGNNKGGDAVAGSGSGGGGASYGSYTYRGGTGGSGIILVFA